MPVLARSAVRRPPSLHRIRRPVMSRLAKTHRDVRCLHWCPSDVRSQGPGSGRVRSAGALIPSAQSSNVTQCRRQALRSNAGPARRAGSGGHSTRAGSHSMDLGERTRDHAFADRHQLRMPAGSARRSVAAQVRIASSCGCGDTGTFTAARDQRAGRGAAHGASTLRCAARCDCCLWRRQSFHLDRVRQSRCPAVRQASRRRVSRPGIG